MPSVIMIQLSLMAIALVSASPTIRSSDTPAFQHHHLRTLTASGSTEHIGDISDHHDIGEDVVDNDGHVVNKTGHLSCFISNGVNGVPLKKPIISKKLYRYCLFSLTHDSNELGISYGYNGEDDGKSAFIENQFKRDKPVVYFEEEYYFHKDKPETRRVFFCRTNACNPPVQLLSYLKFNFAEIKEKNSILNYFGYQLV